MVNQKYIVGISLTIVVVAAVGATMVLADESAESPVDNTTLTQDETPTETPVRTEFRNETWDAEDPGLTSYPEDPENAEDLMLSTDRISKQFYRTHFRFLEQNGYEGQYNDGKTMESVARVHSKAMAENNYIGPKGPNGEEFTPERYEGLQVSCLEVTRVVYKYDRVVVGPDGERKQMTSKSFAADMFSEMVNNETMREQLMKDYEEYDAAGYGFYLTNEENENGATVVNAYLTIDFCSGWKGEEMNASNR